jgi:hypothetical protein
VKLGDDLGNGFVCSEAREGRYAATKEIRSGAGSSPYFVEFATSDPAKTKAQVASWARDQLARKGGSLLSSLADVEPLPVGTRPKKKADGEVSA